MSTVEILPVDGIARFLTFCKLPRLLYKGAKGFSPPLDVERWTLHSHRLNPHFKRVEAQEFLARRDGKWTGRIMAQVYKPEITPVGASRAQFGSLDAIDDIEVVRALTGAAESWLASRGATRINGPVSPSIWGEPGLLVEGFEATPMISVPWHPPWLARHLEALGYEKAQDLYSYRLDITRDELDKPARISNRREWRDRLKLRPVDFDRLKTGETALLAELFNDGWRDNWGFVPLGQDELDSIAGVMPYVMPPDFGVIVELDGVPQSFAIAFPNIHEIFGDLGGKLFPFGLARAISRIRNHKFATARLLLLGTRKALQKSATGGAVLLSMIEELRRRGARASITHLEAGWVLEDNLDMRRPIEMFGGKVDKIHRIYEKRLAAGAPSEASASASASNSVEATPSREDATP